MKHTNVGSTSERSYGSAASQQQWQERRAALRQGNVVDGEKRSSFAKSDSVFNTVAENRFTYGKAGHTNWDFDTSKAGAKAPVSGVERQDKRESGKHIFAWTPKMEQSNPATVLQSNRVTVAEHSVELQRYRVTVKDKVTGKDIEVTAKLITNVISILTYGKLVEFRMTNRSKRSFKDMRDGKDMSRDIGFAKSELQRWFGVTVGNEWFAKLTTFTLPPKRPATGNTEAPTPESGERTVVSVQQNADGSVTGIERSEATGSQGGKQFDEQGIRVA